MKPQGRAFTNWLRRLGVLSDFQQGMPWGDHIQPVAIVEDISHVQAPAEFVTCAVFMARTPTAGEYPVFQVTALRTPVYISQISCGVGTLYRIYLGTADQIDNDRTVVTPTAVIGGTLEATVEYGDATGAPAADLFYKETGISSIWLGTYLQPGERMAIIGTTAGGARQLSLLFNEVPFPGTPNP